MTTASESSLKIQPEFKKMIIMSIGFHVGIFLFFTLKLALFPSDRIEYQQAIRVDLVGLPQKFKAPEAIPEPPRPVPIKTEPEKISKPVLIPKTEPQKINLDKKRQAAFEKLKEMSAFDKLKKLNAEEKPKTQTAAAPIAGSVITPGTALKGLDKIQFNEYLESIQKRAHEHWALPEWIARANLSAQAVVKIDRRGFVVEKFLKRASGNAEFDQMVLDSIEKASPFQAPPERLQSIVNSDGVVLGFPE